MARPVCARVAGVLLLIVAAACGSENSTETGTEIEASQARTALIHSLFARPSTVVAGGETTLSWKTRDVASLTLTSPGGEEIAIPAEQVAQGELVVRPGASTRYTLTAQAVEGVLGPVWRSVEVTVTEAEIERPTIESFTATPDRAAVGDEVTLAWRTAGATDVVLKNDLGEELDLAGASPDDGEVTVTLAQHGRRFVLTALNPGGRATSEVAVDLLVPPLVTHFFTLPLEPVEVGGETTLVWETSRAERVTIVDDLGATVVDTTAELSGQQVLVLDRSAIFTITAHGEGGEAVAEAMARVAPTIELFAASEQVVRAGDPVDLTWRIHDADTAVIAGPGGISLAIDPADFESGSERIDVQESGDVVLTATRDDVPRTWSVFVEVTQAPRVREVAVAPAEVTAAEVLPANVEVSWQQDGGETCLLFANNVPSGEPFDCSAGSGTIAVQVTGTTSFRLEATNAHGMHVGFAQVIGVPPPRIPLFARTPARKLTPGDDVTLTWEVLDAISVRLEANGAHHPGVGGTQFTGSLTEAVLVDTTYVLSAENRLGHRAVAEFLVKAGAPDILDFTAEPSFVALGDDVLLAWTADGGETLSVEDGDGVVLCTAVDPAQIDLGTCPVLAPETAGTYPYTLRIANGAGTETTATVDLTVTDGPMIRAFAASRSPITLGETVELGWTVDDDAYGADPVLALADDQGNTYALTGLDPNQGTITLEPAMEGTFVFTLTATTAGTLPHALDVTVDVGAPPVIDDFSATPDIASTQDGTVVPDVVLSWATTNATELSLWELDAGGQPIPPAIHRVPAGDPAVAAGTLTVHPTASTTWQLRAENRIGSVVTENLKVVVDPPEIVSFEANPPEIVAGELAQLQWVTKNADELRLDPMEPTILDRSNSFLDISSTGTPVTFSATYNQVERVDFPAGFTFPWDGEERTAVRMTTSGYLSFDLTSTGKSYSNYPFPTSSTYAYVHLAAFWDYLDAYQTGQAYWELRTDPTSGEDFLVFMWKDFNYRTTSAQTNLNFEILLWESGVFEFRYGQMAWLGGSTTYQQYPDGKYATVGYQMRDLGYAWTVLDDMPWPGGLSNQGWSFDLRMPAVGGRGVSPSGTRLYTLIAANEDLEVEADVEVTVWAVPQLLAASVRPAGPEAGTPFRINWKTSSATQVDVYDGQGTPICTVTDPAQVAEGHCLRTEPTGGNYSYTVEARNGLARNVVSETINISVFPKLTIDSATVSGEFVTSGTPVTFTWTATGAFEAFLDLCVPHTGHAQCTPVDISSQPLSGGSVTVTLTESKEFWFRIADPLYRIREVSLPVWVDAARITSFTSSSTQVAAGGSVTLSWSSTDADSASLNGMPPPEFTEIIDGSAPWVDLVTDGGTQPSRNGSADGGNYVVPFPDGFRFKYFGVEYDSARASTDGWLSFDVAGSNTTDYSNDPLPAASNPYIHLAPLWDDLEYQTSSDFRYKLYAGPTGRYLVISWIDWSHWSSTYATTLNFQVVLHESGQIDFRYGTMTASSSYPQYAQGYSATIGYQTQGAGVGTHLAPQGQAMPGGLQGRSFRVDPGIPGNGTAVMTPSETTTYEFCVTNESLYVECEAITVVVVDPGDLLFTELMVAPASADAEWVELRNTSRDPIDLGGMVLTSGTTETVTLPASLVVPPGAFAVLARSGDPAVNGGLTPLAVYGTGLGLDDASDDVALTLDGTLIDRVTWTASWPIVAGQSLALEPSVMAPSMGANDAAADWCATTAVYGGGLGGSPGALGAGCLTAGGHAFYVLDPIASVPFVDISATGTDVSSIMTSVYYTPMIPIGFVFPYFGDTASELSIGRHGYVSLAPTSGYDSSNEALPSSTDPDGMIAPFWDYLYNRSGETQIQYETRVVGGAPALIVQWTRVAAGSSSYGFQTFQIQLRQDGDIAFVYPEIVKTGSYDYPFGSSATIGLEDLAGTTGLLVSHGTSNSGGGPLYSGRSYLFLRK